MSDEFNTENIQIGNYNFDVSKYFFNADIFRLIIIIFIIISFIVNVLYFITSLKTKFKDEILQINLILTRNILFINFLHKFSYLYEWVLQNVDNESSLYVNKDNGEIGTIENKDDKNYFRIGGLLVGNMYKMEACKAQGFFLVFTSLSQDIVILILFYMVNKSTRLSKAKTCIFLSVGYLCSFIISIIYLSVNGLGLNDKYCFIKKFIFDEKQLDKPYQMNSNFILMIIIYYLIRLIFIIICSILLYKIVQYIKKNEYGKGYLIRLSSFLLLQIFSIAFGIMYRIGGLINEKFSRDFVDIFLIVNNLDALVFPLFSFFSNNMYLNLCGKKKNDELENVFMLQDNDVTTNPNATMNNQTRNNDKSGISTPNGNNNNFEVSYL
jgi:hypothetical protein